MINPEFSISDEDVASFREHGFLKLNKIFSDDLVEHMKKLSTAEIAPPADNYGSGFSKLKYDIGNDDATILRDGRPGLRHRHGEAHRRAAVLHPGPGIRAGEEQEHRFPVARRHPELRLPAPRGRGLHHLDATDPDRRRRPARRHEVRVEEAAVR
ncbi:hypothetical protein LT493_23530 [Streptomyces tricolor]|nr:hypothetical protein [Streptomyces tricolor]